MTATAYLFEGASTPLRRVSLPKPQLQAGEAWTKVRLCTLCGSDLHTYFGRRQEPVPTVLGHEIVAEVEDLGPGGMLDVANQPLKPGDRIVWSVAVSCGNCFFCQNSLPQKCESVFKYGHALLRRNSGPHGGLASHCHLLARTAVVRVPPSLPDSLAAPAMCSTATVAAIFRNLESCRNRVVLIFGAGLLGQTAAMMASENFARSVIVADPSGARLDRLRATAGNDPIVTCSDSGQLSSIVAELTDGRGVDAAIELSGANPAVEAALQQVRIGGQVVLAGSVAKVPAISVNPEQLVRRMLRVVGVHNYEPADLLSAVAFLDATVDRGWFSDLVEVEFPLTEVEAAFRYAEEKKPLRVAVKPT